MGDHGIFEPLFDPAVSGDEALDRMERDSKESVERHFTRASSPHKLMVERFVEEWPDTVQWCRGRVKLVEASVMNRASSHVARIEDRLLKVVGKVIDATHKAQLDRRAGMQRAGYSEYGRPAVHVVAKYANPVFRQIAKLRTKLTPGIFFSAAESDG